MTNERPINDAQCWLINAADKIVDIYVNYDEELTSVAPTEDGPVFSIDSDANRIYGTYTFEAREVEAGHNDPSLAAASVKFEEGDSYAAVFHQVGDTEYEMSIYKNDFSPSANVRFEIRHTARPEQIDWRIAPNEGADPDIPVDEREGTLERGQWQQALDVTENDYRLEVLVDGEVVALRQDLDFGHNRMIVGYVVNDPEPWMSSEQKESHIWRQEYQIQTGEQKENVVTPPAEPFSATNQNQTIQFDCNPLELYHTNLTETEIGATDPDGIVTGLSIGEVVPYSDGFDIPHETVERASAIGGATTATLRVTPKVPPTSYDVRLVANPEGLGERATCSVPIEVKQITVERLHYLVEQYHESGDINEAITNDLEGLLDDAAAHLADDETEQACNAFKEILTIVGANKAKGISVPATVDMETETKALHTRLGCG